MILKTKLSLGLAFLFLIIFTVVGFCSYYVGRLGQESDNILKDNYNSLVYARNMLAGLDDMRTSVSSLTHSTGRGAQMSEYYRKLFESGKDLFDANLKTEKNNITEIHEKEYVEKLNQNYETFLKLCFRMKSEPTGLSAYFSEFLPACEKLKQSINSIYDVNMQAVVRKSEATKHDSRRFVNSMAIMGSLCILLALGYFWYFPVYISTTLSYLSEKMRKLLKKNGIALDTTTNDEAYVILQGINLLENRLDGGKERQNNGSDSWP